MSCRRGVIRILIFDKTRVSLERLARTKASLHSGLVAEQAGGQAPDETEPYPAA